MKINDPITTPLEFFKVYSQFGYKEGPVYFLAHTRAGALRQYYFKYGFLSDLRCLKIKGQENILKELNSVQL